MPDPAITLRTAPCWTLALPDGRPVAHAEDDEPHYYTHADAQRSVARYTTPGRPAPVPRPFEHVCAVAIAACGTAFEGKDGEVHLDDEQTMREVLVDAGYRFTGDGILRCSPDNECTECDAAIAEIERVAAENTPLPGQITLIPVGADGEPDAPGLAGPFGAGDPRQVGWNPDRPGAESGVLTIADGDERADVRVSGAELDDLLTQLRWLDDYGSCSANRIDCDSGTMIYWSDFEEAEDGSIQVSLYVSDSTGLGGAGLTLKPQDLGPLRNRLRRQLIDAGPGPEDDHCGGQGWTAGDGPGQTGLLTDQDAQPEVSSR
jgi:hypothetical protein